MAGDTCQMGPDFRCRVIIEAGLENYRIDPSQGTHFFQNITSFRMDILPSIPISRMVFYDLEFLDNLPAAVGE